MASISCADSVLLLMHSDVFTEFPSSACKSDVDCMGDNVVCASNNGHCACRHGYHPVGSYCRK